MKPAIIQALPGIGPTSGGGLVQLYGHDFGPSVQVRFDDQLAEVVSLRKDLHFEVIAVRPPEHSEALVSISVQNLDHLGLPIPDESYHLSAGYLYRRPPIVEQADLSRVVRRLLKMLKTQVLENTSLSTSVDFQTDDSPLRLTPLAETPALVLSGPDIKVNRLYGTRLGYRNASFSGSGEASLRRRPPHTVDLHFSLTAVSNRTVELLNLLARLASFFNINKYLSLRRDPDNPDQGFVSYELDPLGDINTQLRHPDDLRSFTTRLVIRGFDLDQGQTVDLTKPIDELALEVKR